MREVKGKGKQMGRPVPLRCTTSVHKLESRYYPIGNYPVTLRACRNLAALRPPAAPPPASLMLIAPLIPSPTHSLTRSPESSTSTTCRRLPDRYLRSGLTVSQGRPPRAAIDSWEAGTQWSRASTTSNSTGGRSAG